MLENGNTIIPVFYHVQPYEVRWTEVKDRTEGKRQVYADALSEHEKKGIYTSQEIQRWKLALQQASFYSGDIINNKDDEQRVLKNDVNRVLKLMEKVPLEVAKHPVGLDEAVQEFEMTASQSGQSHDSAQIVGIWGMGGSGKTTLAKELYNRKCSAMKRSSFLFDLRDAAVKGLLLQKQKKLLEDLGYNGASFDHVDQGKGILGSRFRSVSALIVLDDVDHPDQLDALLPAKDGLGPGSLIIVTTRELDVLRCWGVSAVHKMRALNSPHAEQLFCWHAFLQPSPVSGFEDLVEKFVIACESLPLSLKVLGGQLYGKSGKDYWVSQFDKISRILPADIENKLKLSYDALDKEEKEMFLDTSCFFIGKNDSLAIAVWEGSGWSGLVGWEKLVNKCLVELDEDNCIRMHDHLRDLGRAIANQKSPYRLFSPEQIIDIQPQKKRIRIRGVVNATDEFPRWSSRGKIKINTSEGVRSLKPSMLGLKIFSGDGDFLDGEVYQLSKELVLLRCSKLEQRNLPSWPSLKNLRILKFHEVWNLEKLWEVEADAPLQLIELVIVDCNMLKGLPRSIGYLRRLKYISVCGSSMESLPNEFCLLQSLEQLQLNNCENLLSLPRRFGDLTNLRHLDLSGCIQLRMLPVTFKQLTLLQSFRLFRTSIREVPASIGQLTKLEILNVGSQWLTSLPISLGSLSSLSELKIHYCNLLESLPKSLGRLNLLKNFSLERTGVKFLPESFTQLTNLQTLSMNFSPIPELSLGLGCKLNTIRLYDSKVSKISISEDCCPCLETLELFFNDHLMEVENLPTTVETLLVMCCRMLKNIRGIRGLANLEWMVIDDCPELDALPSFVELISLKEFELKGCHKVKKIEGLEHLKSVEKFRAYSCLKAPCMVRLDSTERLSELVVVANERSVVERCIPTIEKWPSEVIICTRAVCDVGSLVDSVHFSNLCVLSFAKAEIPVSYEKALKYICSYKGEDAILVCFRINCVWGDRDLIMGPTGFPYFKTKLGKGKWVWMGVFTQGSFGCFGTQDYVIWECGVWKNAPRNEVEAAWLVSGKEESVVEAFHHILYTFTR